ncbi:MAG: TonB-dependent receptor [Opitutaceae bacterium]
MPLKQKHPGQASRASRGRAAGLMLTAFAALAGNAGFAQTPPTESEEKATDAVVVLPEFTVTGIRESLIKAIDIKRESVPIMDSIVAEDIGKFPDNNVVEALQRLTGVQVTNRGAGEIAAVSIRGLNDINTTLNGQNIFTASGQAVALQDIPATLLSRVDVFKTRSADMVENGIAGAIDVRTHRPFDFKGAKFGLAARGIYQEQADKIGPNLSALASNWWKTGAGKVGALINVSFAETHYRDQNVTAGAMMPFTTNDPHAHMAPYQLIRSVYKQGDPEAGAVDPQYWGVVNWTPGLEDGLPTAPGSTMTVGGQTKPYVLSRDAIFQNDFTGTRKRPAANIALQWAPNESSEYTFEAFYSGYRNTSFNNLFFSFVDWWGGPLGEVTLYPGTNIVKSRETVSWVYGFTSGDATIGKTDSLVYSLSGKWDIGENLKLRSMASYQTSKFSSSFFAMRADRVAPDIWVDFNSGGGLPAFGFRDNPSTTVDETNLTDPSLWNLAQLYDNANRNKGSAKTVTVDGDYTIKSNFFTGLKFGLRYDDREASEAQRTSTDVKGVWQSFANFPEIQHVNSGFFDGQSDVPTTWVVPDGIAISKNADFWRELVGYPTSDALELKENFNVNERNLAAYLRADFKTFIGHRRLDGQIGARYVNVKTDMQFGEGSASVKKGKLLPSGSVRFAITPDLYLRASYAETLRRPNFADLNPNIIYVKDVTNIGYGTATGGNPNLRATESKNYDLALEWYFDKGNAIYVSAFKRKIDGFVVSFRKRVSATVPPDTTPYDYILSQPDNASNGELTGFEVGAVYFPDYLPEFLKGLGVQASYTNLDSSQDVPAAFDSQGNVTQTIKRSLFGVSDSSYSVMLAYERKRVSARLSYVWRSSFLNNYEAALFANPLGVYRKPEQSLDFQLSYRVTDRLTLTLDATNLTEEIYQSYYGEGGSTTNNFGSSLYSRTIALGARYSF